MSLLLVIKATLVLLAGMAIAAVCRRRSASVRHAIRIGTLGAILALPALSRVAPEWSIASPASLGIPEIPDQPAVATPASTEAPGAPAPSASTATPRTGPAGVADAGRLHLTVSGTAAALWGIWVAGMLVLVARLLAGFESVRRLCARSSAARDPLLEEELQWARSRSGIRRPIRLLTSREVEVPVTAGLIWPALVLPTHVSDWSQSRARAVIQHEVAHVGRFDLWTQTVGRLAVALFWFHPLTWWMLHRACDEQEQACDDAVLAAGEVATRYAHDLVEIVSDTHGASLGGAIAMARPSRLEGRIIALLSKDLARGPQSRRSRLLTSTAGIAVTLAVSGMTVAPRVRPPPFASGTEARVFSCDLTPGTLNSQRVGGMHGTHSVSWQGRDCSVTIQTVGDVSAGVELRDLDAVTPGASFAVTVQQGGSSRFMNVTSRPTGGRAYTYLVNGHLVAMDAPARTWLAGVLTALERVTGANAMTRVPALLYAGGLALVQTEIRTLQTDAARAAYLRALLANRTPVPEPVAIGVLEDVRTEVQGSFEASGVLIDVLQKALPADSVERRAFYGAVDAVHDDFLRAKVLTTFVGSPQFTAGDVSSYLRLTTGIADDVLKVSTLSALASGRRLTGSDRAAYLVVANGIKGPFERREARDALSP